MSEARPGTPRDGTAPTRPRKGIALLKPQPNRKVRKKPKGHEGAELPKRNIPARLAILGVILAVALGFLISLTDMSYFETTFYVVDDDRLENPMRIALLADLHLNEFGEGNTELVDRIGKLKPDLIAIAGDMMNDDNPDDSVVITLCGQLVGIAPVYYCFGNHEGYVIRVAQTSDLDVRLRDLGVHVLHNDYETVSINGNTLDLGCLDANPSFFYESYVTRFWEKYVKTDNYRLLIAHYPNYFMEGAPLADGKDVDMALCGHLHGGQIVLPGLGGLYHPSTGFLPELASGVHLVGSTVVVTSRGLGNHGVVPRVNNPPELVVIDVQ